MKVGLLRCLWAPGIQGVLDWMQQPEGACTGSSQRRSWTVSPRVSGWECWSPIYSTWDMTGSPKHKRQAQWPTPASEQGRPPGKRPQILTRVLKSFFFSYQIFEKDTYAKVMIIQYLLALFNLFFYLIVCVRVCVWNQDSPWKRHPHHATGGFSPGPVSALTPLCGTPMLITSWHLQKRIPWQDLSKRLTMSQKQAFHLWVQCFDFI